MSLAYIPSPAEGVWHVGAFPLRAYALCIIVGVIVAVVIGERRWVARGGAKGAVADMAGIAVPFGLVGGRIYHVITSPSQYLDHPIEALYIWRGGLGIPGGILGGVIAGIIICKRRGIRPGAMADAIAPGVPIAQAIGRVGNYFNQELFGRPTQLPWGLEIDPDNPDAVPGAEAYHPTFLYEALWNLGVAGVVLWADRRWRLGHGRSFALYLALYAVGRAWIEALRIDDASRLFGLRLNDYVAVVVFLGATAYLVRRRGAGREDVVQDPPPAADEEPADVALGP
ncbi:MAG: prolipoprotein diacylglyceryl transferase [Frankiaceae bacterium]|nr:prolipoprotein diacylglyceryl transferase [Frankiaceae bacterium]